MSKIKEKSPLELQEIVTGKKTNFDHKFCFKLKNISYRIELDSEKGIAKIHPIVELDSEGHFSLISALYIDSHEMLPSTRHSITKGINKIEFNSIKIIRPKKFWKEQKSSAKYTMSMLLSDDGENYLINKEPICIDEWED